MLTIDDRQGSKELYPMLKNTPAQLGFLDYADVAFLGRGEADTPITVGIERKKIMDFLQSMTSGRLSGHQIPGMLNAYNVRYLIIEGIWSPDPKTGIIKAWKREMHLGSRKFSAKEVFGYISTLQIRRGLYIWKTATMRETAQLIQVLYTWWTKKTLDAHISYLAQHQEYADLCVKKLPFIQRVAAELTGMGRKKAKRVCEKFSTLQEMIQATEKDWMSIGGIGKTLAKKIKKELGG